MKSDKPKKSSSKKPAASKSIRKQDAGETTKSKSAAKAVSASAAAKADAKPAAPKAKRKAAAKTVSTKLPPVPSILLEEESATPAISGPGQRYALGPTPAQHSAVATGDDLPEAYGTRRLLVTARDPHWLYARWDLTREQQRKYNALSADRHLVLRIFLNEAKGQPRSEIHVQPESTHWFAHVDQAGAKYVAELGYYVAGKWTSISISAATLTPPDSMSEDVSAEFASIPMDIPFVQLLEFAQAVVQKSVPLVEVLQQLRASGYNIPETRVSTTEKWTPERQHALASIITMDNVRRVWMGSLEITELIRRQLQQQISSMSAAQFSQSTSPSGAFSSVSSPFGGSQGAQKGFWFNVNAELIIYGATEPDAQVTIGGRVIKLRPDGTFSYRFALPDGEYELPAVAISYDKTDARAAELKFTRSTEYRGDVGVHPQDSALKPPLLEHVA